MGNWAEECKYSGHQVAEVVWREQRMGVGESRTTRSLRLARAISRAASVSPELPHSDETSQEICPHITESYHRPPPTSRQAPLHHLSFSQLPRDGNGLKSPSGRHEPSARRLCDHYDVSSPPRSSNPGECSPEPLIAALLRRRSCDDGCRHLRPFRRPGWSLSCH